MHAELPVVAFLCAALLSLALLRLWRAGNAPFVAVVSWLLALNIIFAIDSIIWAKRVDIVAKVWCDITTKLIMGSNVGLPAACLCLCLKVMRESCPLQARPLPRTATSARMIHILLCVIPPFIYMAMHCIVQDHRFDIIEDIGCRPAVYMSIPALFLIWVPPWALSLAAILFAWRAFRQINRSTSSSEAHEDKALVRTQLHSLVMALSLIAWLMVASTAYLDFSILSSDGIKTWPSFQMVHAEMSRVDVHSRAFTPQWSRSFYFSLWWTVPFASLLVLAFTIHAEELPKLWRRILRPSGAPQKLTETGSRGMASCETVESSQAPTIKFGPRPGDFFTVPDYGKPVSPSLPKDATLSPTSPATDGLPSFLPSILSHHGYSDEAQSPTFAAVVTAPPMPDLNESISGPQRVPEPRYSSYSSSWLKLSVPSSCASAARHISISSVRQSLPQSPSEYASSALDGLDPRVPPGLYPEGIDARLGGEYQFELSPRLGEVPTAPTVQHEIGRGGAIYMTVVKETV